MRSLLCGAWLCLAFLAPPALAQENPIDIRRQVLEEEQAALARAKAELEARRETVQKRLKDLDALKITPILLEQARLDVEAARTQLESIKLDQASSQRTLKDLEDAVTSLEEQLKELQGAQEEETQARIASLREQLAEKRALLELERQHREHLKTAYTLAQERLALAKRWYASLKEEFERRQAETRKATLEEVQLKLQKEQQAWIERAAALRKRLEGAKAEQRPLLETQVLMAEERAKLAQLKLKLARAESRLKDLEAIPPNAPAATLRDALTELDTLTKELSAEKALWERKVEVFTQQRQVLQKLSAPKEMLKDLEGLIEASQGQIALLGYLLRKAQEGYRDLQALYDESIRRGLLTRSRLPKDAAGWQALTAQLATLPRTYGQRLWALAQDLVLAWGRAGIGRWALLILLEALWFGLMHVRRRWLHLQSLRLSRQPTLRVMAELLERNSASVALAGGTFIAVWLAGLSRLDVLIAAAVILTALGTKVFINLAWVILVQEGYQPALYPQLRAFLLGAGLFTAITLLGHIIPLPLEVRDVLDRLFMAFLLLTAFPAFGIRRLLLEYLKAQFGMPYWLKAVSFISLLLPLSILATAFFGILGYLNLAWSIGQHLAWLMAALALWLTLRGLLRDGAAFLRRFAYRHSARGSLLARAVIDPLHRLAQIGLFLLAWLALFRLYGWDSQTPWVSAILRFIEAPLFTVGETPVSLAKLAFIALAIYLLIGLGRWMREIAFHWIYGGIADVGVRHSLAVFTQYALVLLGFLILLRTGGIDLTTLALFAGALGVGIGFGLQNIANNFVSGLLLLAERPLKVGDIVRIHDYEGKVTRIGMRSLTVTTWDNQEVIIPNADAISNAFINWTHGDNVVRTLITVGISYDDDPHKAVAVARGVLDSHPPVLKQPPPEVWLAEFADSTVNLCIQYFIDVLRHNRWAVRSQVLLMLWDAFKAEGIHIPYPQRDIHIRSMPP